jgi:hypothetical protein
MRILRDSLPFGALCGAPLTAFASEVLLPGLAGFGLVVLIAGWLRRRT